MERKIRVEIGQGACRQICNRTVMYIHSCKLAQKELQSKEVGRKRQQEEGELDLIMAENSLGAFFLSFFFHFHLDKNNKD